MSRKNHVRVDLKNGINLVIPIVEIDKIVMPNVVINNKFHRLVVDESILKRLPKRSL